MQDFLDDFRATLESESVRLMAIPEEIAVKRLAPGKWSPKEVIGHLIGSASNNHGRFVRAELADDMVFQEYDQDEWVRVQGYNQRSWRELVTFWRSYNSHIATLVEGISPERLSLQRTRHNLDEIAWRTVPRGTPATLEYFNRDYLGHMKPHLVQIP